jgi:flagellar biosynthesis anti-sigma factor FlgM
MIISFPDSTSSATSLENQQPARTTTSSSTGKGEDAANLQESSSTEISLSSTGVQALRAQLTTVPSVRQERVQALQNAVGNGTYNPSSQQIADAIHADLFGGSSNSGS